MGGRRYRAQSRCFGIRRDGLPIPKALYVVLSRTIHAGFAPAIQMPMADFTKIPSDTLTLVIVGDQWIRMARSEDTGKDDFYALLTHVLIHGKEEELCDAGFRRPRLAAADRQSHGAPVGREVLDPDAEDFDRASIATLSAMRMEQKLPDALAYYGIWKLV